MRRKIIIFLIVMASVLASFFGWLFLRIKYTSQLDVKTKSDAIVVLGAASYAGKPSPVLQARLDQAVLLFNEGVSPLIITTGGTHKGEKFSEGEVGKKYLESKGIDSASIVADTESMTTKQNLSRVFEISKERNLTSITLVSDPFHMYRAAIIAKDLGFESYPSPTRTSPISQNFWLENWYSLREAFLSLIHIVFDA